VSRTVVRGFALEIEGNNAETRGARFSPDYQYRYSLWRTWNAAAPALVVIGLNPSTADATVDDPTIRRCIGFAKRERLGGLVMLNLFGLRATDPSVMLRHAAPIGPDNDRLIMEAVHANRLLGSVFVAAWGVHGAHMSRDHEMRGMVRGLKCFGVTQTGYPRHPLYLRGDAPLVDLPYPRGAA
jgi:hypothetical protein